MIRFGSAAIRDYIQQRRLSWWGHMRSMNDNIQTKRVWETEISKKKEKWKTKGAQKHNGEVCGTEGKEMV